MMEGRFEDIARLNVSTLDALGVVFGVLDEMTLLNKTGKVDTVRSALMEFVSKDF
jgi:hypothetical protein